MEAPRDAWNRDYSMRGRRWAGFSSWLPSISECGRILEIGCGDGKTLGTLSGLRTSSFVDEETGPMLIGLDFSPAALRLCSHALLGAKNVTLVCADAVHLPFSDSSFDTVLFSHVLGHAVLQARKAMCKEAGRVIRSGGNVIFRVFSVNDFRSGKGEEIEEKTYLRGDGTFTHYFQKSEILTLNPFLSVISLKTPSWDLHIRGKTFLREEIHAIFRKDLP